MELKRDLVVIAGKPQGYSTGTKVTGASGFVFLSGSIGTDVNTGQTPTDAGEQARIALEGIKARLEEYGTSLKNILHMRTLVSGNFPNGVARDPRYPQIGAAIQAFWKEHCPEFQRGQNPPPASTLVGVTGLGISEWQLEIEVVAAIP